MPLDQNHILAPVRAPSEVASRTRLGVDLGGTKIAAALLGPDGVVIEERRTPNPGAYEPLLAAVRDLCDGLSGREVAIGMGIPGSISPTTGLVRNCNSTFVNGRDLAADLALATGRRVRIANDANCFALSEAVDGAAAGSPSVFGVIIGTGVGGGIVVDGALVDGAGGIGGEWGHIPLPWPDTEEHHGRACWCGLRNCMETWASGPALERDYGQDGVRAPEIVSRALAGDMGARAALDRYVSRLARGLAVICNVLDPHVIVLGGGMSNVDHLYEALPAAMRPYLFTDQPANRLVKNRHGDASGVRGAAWLWPL
jgi:fructokinase